MTILKYYDETGGVWKPFVNNANDAVTLSSDQTIAGKKTFTEDVNVNGDIYSNGEHIFLAVHPVGAIYMSVSSVNPGTLFGGTWVEWGKGRVPVGVDTAQTEFSTVEKTGGHKLMQSHAHSASTNHTGEHSHQMPDAYTFTAPLVRAALPGGNIVSNATKWTMPAGGHSHTVTVNSTGGGDSQNLQPYVTCYMWKRTA